MNISRSKLEAIEVLAHWCMAADITKNVPGFEGFLADYEKDMTPHHRALVNRFKQSLKSQAESILKHTEKKPEGIQTVTA